MFLYLDSEKPLAATSSSTSLHGNKKFTKICEKNSATKTEGMKLNRTNDSPLLMAFNNQDQQKTLDNNEKDFQISKSIEKKKELPKKTSLRDYLCLPSKDIDKSSANLMTNQRPTKSNPAKRKCDVAVDGITQEKTRTCRTESKWGSRSKRRRESEGNMENRDKTVEGSIDRGSKKVKLVVDDQDLMQLTKG